MPDAGFPVEMVSGVPVVVTPEEVDITNAAGLRGALLETAAARDGTLVVDMSRTAFCDTAGIHALVGAHKRAHAERGELRLVVTTPAVRRILALTGLDQVIPHFGSREDALAAPFPAPGTADGR
ncbi:MAG TPA: STAS domain-containing protein [Streptosporangiaceae bacterium]|nr:STAS domain-containing protein [Streptosporangiaceae bacterium]